MLLTFKILNLFYRNYSGSVLTSKEIRQRFLDYFLNENGHQFVRSSPVVPYCDPSVVFVNAGMNQFKNIFLGKTIPPCEQAANSQKCIRVGGKHNDLSIVGSDGYHHTFFEMLGNWSFGSYFKKEACTHAWHLLTGPYGIDPRLLYVTYFEGNQLLGLQADEECKEIWRQLGIPAERIIPFGLSDNFWEMGTTGPCGPCTEIHIDHTKNVNNSSDRWKMVNANCADLTELWNIVFIEYIRNSDGSLSTLPMKHVDTGMGMERLVAFLQHKSSNYATDLFMPIIHQIHKTTKVPQYQDIYDTNNTSMDLNRAYRITVDHSRMITACLADGMFPEQNYKLRRVIRKIFHLSKRQFNHSNVLRETVPIVAEILGETYPEMQLKLSQILQIIEHEYDLYKSLLQSTSQDIKQILSNNTTIDEDDIISFPGFIPAYKELKTKCKNTSILSGELIFKLYDTYGLNEELIQQLAQSEQLKLDRDGFDILMAKTKQRTKSLFAEDNKMLQTIQLNCAETSNNAKYNYKYDVVKQEYVIEPIEAKILYIDQDNEQWKIILDQSNFYYESGGQQCDIGQIVANNVVFNVDNVQLQNGYVIHSGNFSKGQFNVGDVIQTVVDCCRRSGNIRNHTATHLLNASVRQITKRIVYQKSSSVTWDCLKLELGILGTKKLECDQVEQIEQLMRRIVKSTVSIQQTLINGYDLYASENVTLVPGEVYPDKNIRLISIRPVDDSIEFASNEPCCGTHAKNTVELIDICITSVKQTGRSSYNFTAVTGENAVKAHEIGIEMLSELNQLKAEFQKKTQKSDKFHGKVLKLKMRLLEAYHECIPHVIKTHCLRELDEIDKQLKDVFREMLRDFVNIEMKSVLESYPATSKHPFIVHYLSIGGLMMDIPLHKATQHCTNRPIMILSLSDNNLTARCCVPKTKITNNFNAKIWMQEVATIFHGSKISSPSGKNPEQITNLKSRKIHVSEFEEQLDVALRRARDYAKKYLT